MPMVEAAAQNTPMAAVNAASGADPAATGDQPVTPLRRPWLVDSREVVYDPRLAAALDAAFAGVDGRIAVAVKDLGTGRGALLAPQSEMPSASLFKLPVLYSVFAAGLPLDQELLITDQIKSFDLGTLELGTGESLTVAEAVERMVTISDNSSAILLANRVTSARIDSDIAALGMATTHYRADRLTTSAGDTLALLERLARGQAVSPAASADMVHVLLRQRVNDRLPRLLPSAARVAHKTGNLPGVVNDVGIVYGPSSTVIVAALIADTSDDTAATDAIAHAALAAYSYAEAQPDRGNGPVVPPAPGRPIPPIWREARPLPADTLPSSALPGPPPTAIVDAANAGANQGANEGQTATATAPKTTTAVSPDIAATATRTPQPTLPPPTVPTINSPPRTSAPPVATPILGPALATRVAPATVSRPTITPAPAPPRVTPHPGGR